MGKPMKKSDDIPLSLLSALDPDDSPDATSDEVKHRAASIRFRICIEEPSQFGLNFDVNKDK